MKSVFFLLLPVFITCSCSDKKTSCELKLEREYPEILQLIDSLHLESSYELSCVTTLKADTTFFGQSERNADGLFFKDSGEFKGLMLHEFHFLNPTTKATLYKFKVFQFDEKGNEFKFQVFTSSISRQLNHVKEIHSFFYYPNKTILYYKGFP